MDKSKDGFLVPPEIADYIIQHPNEVYISSSQVYFIKRKYRKWWQFWKPKQVVDIRVRDLTDNGKP